MAVLILVNFQTLWRQVTGAIRTFFLSRQIRPEEIEFRVAVPVSVRRENERDRMSNRVSAWSIRLPIEHSDPLQQLEAIGRVCGKSCGEFIVNS
jgi:hypothetical protein